MAKEALAGKNEDERSLETRLWFSYAHYSVEALSPDYSPKKNGVTRERPKM